MTCLTAQHPGDIFQYPMGSLDSVMHHSASGDVGLWAESALHGGHAEMGGGVPCKVF